jgi:hypothetical protein
MSATQTPAGSDAEEPQDGIPSAVPDEDGPHDVPDDKVIEKTLPSKPVGEGSDRPA